MDTNSNGGASHNLRYGQAAAILLFLLSAAELSRVVGPSWPGFPEWASRSVSVMLAVLWSSTAIALLVRRRATLLAKTAWVLSFASPFTMVAHSLVTMSGHSLLGGLYLPAAALVVFALKRTFDAGEIPRLRHGVTPVSAVGAG